MKTIKELITNESKINEGSSDQKLWKKLDELKDEIGAEQLLDELCKAMSDDEFEENLKFICKNYDINW